MERRYLFFWVDSRANNRVNIRANNNDKRPRENQDGGRWEKGEELRIQHGAQVTAAGRA